MENENDLFQSDIYYNSDGNLDNLLSRNVLKTTEDRPRTPSAHNDFHSSTTYSYISISSLTNNKNRKNLDLILDPNSEDFQPDSNKYSLVRLHRNPFRIEPPPVFSFNDAYGINNTHNLIELKQLGKMILRGLARQSFIY